MMYRMDGGRKISSKNTLIVAVLSFLLILGFWLRMNNLGLLSLTIDEGIEALQIDGILNNGYPLLPSGLINTRSLLYLYTQSLSSLIFGLNEFSLRLPSVLFNLASIVMIYLYGRSLFNPRVGLLSAVILTFSVWEIELSRYGRMYTGFQLFYLLSLFIFYMGFIKGYRTYRFFVPILFIVTFIFHDIGVMLLLAFFVPFVIESYHVVRKRVILIYAGLTGGGFFIYRKALSFMESTRGLVSAKEMSLENKQSTLETLKSAIKNNFFVPENTLLKQLYIYHYWVFLFLGVILLIALGYLAYRVYIDENGRAENLLAMAMIISCFIYQFSLALFFFALFALLSYRGVRSLKGPVYIVIYLSTLFFFLFWVIYVLLSPVPDRYFSLPKAFLWYPHFYGYFLRWFVEGWPLFTLITGAGFMLMAYLYIKDRKSHEYIFSLLVILFPAIFASFIYWPFWEARYTFHLYPLLIVIFSFSLLKISGYISNVILELFKWLQKYSTFQKVIECFVVIFLAVILSQDIYPSEVLAISNRTYKTVKDSVKSSINWEPYANFHQDHKTPALFVKENMHSGDIIIVMGAPHVAPIYYFYIGKVDYALMNKPNNYFERVYKIYKNGEFVHYITGTAAITDPYTLEQVIEVNRGHKIWLLADFYVLHNYYSSDIRYILSRRLNREPLFTGEDGKTFVYLIDSISTAINKRDND